jgi:mannose-6-phosphate isomerase class I
MAAFANVLRAGLTPKYVDTPKLLEITNFTPSPLLWSGTTSRVAGTRVLADS